MDQELKLQLIKEATIHCTNILKHNLELNPEQRVIVIHESGQGIELNDILAAGYQNAIKSLNHQKAEFVLFDKNKIYNDENDPRELSPERAEELKAILYNLNPKDVVVLIQNVNFRISSFRIRLDLKNRGCFVIEHTLLHREQENSQTYINALTYDHVHHKEVCEFILPKIPAAKQIQILSQDNSVLTYEGPFEEGKTNVGNLKANMGSFYPVGEIFTEPVDISKVNGTCQIFAFPNKKFNTVIPDVPFHVEFKDGTIISHTGPKEFQDIIELVQTENENKKVWIREMGFGLNRFLTKQKPLNFISAYERHEGYHISIGLKHGVFRKKFKRDEQGNKINQRFHIDMFVEVKEIKIDNATIFKDNHYLSK